MTEKKKLHLVALPHVQLGASTTCLCAYGSKVVKMCKMLGDDYDIFLYAPEGPAIPGATLHSCLSDQARLEIFGPDQANRLPAWPTDEQSRIFNNEVIHALRTFSEPGELVLLAGGLTHKPIADALPDRLYVEPGVGYSGIIGGGVFAAFESEAWRSFVYGKYGMDLTPRFYDRVIPNYFIPEDFPLMNDGEGKYLAYLGRRIPLKGIQIAADIAGRAGVPLKVAGSGDYKVTGCDVEYVGPLGVADRAKFLAEARALIVATQYFEPFAGVHIEANFCGTPVITSDFGVFPGTVIEGVTGFRMRMLRDGVAAVGKCRFTNPSAIRNYATDRFSLKAVAPLFRQWFNDLGELSGAGWYA